MHDRHNEGSVQTTSVTDNLPFGLQSDHKIKVLQHFEYEVILAVNSLTGNAFPAEITRRLSVTLNRHVSLAQVFVALERLEDKGFVSSRESDPEPVRGGRRRRIFKVEASGTQAIRKTAATFNRMSSAKSEISNDFERTEPSPT